MWAGLSGLRAWSRRGHPVICTTQAGASPLPVPLLLIRPVEGARHPRSWQNSSAIGSPSRSYSKVQRALGGILVRDRHALPDGLLQSEFLGSCWKGSGWHSGKMRRLKGLRQSWGFESVCPLEQL